MPQFDADRDRVIRAAIDSGITRILILGIDFISSQQAIALCEKYPGNLFAAIGAHPNSMSAWTNDTRKQLRALSKSKHVIAIGEIGLDYYRLKNPIEKQKKMFSDQLTLAQELQLPICIHNRNADLDLLEILKKWINNNKSGQQKNQYEIGVMHSFSGKKDLAKFTIENGFYIGVNGTVTYEKNIEIVNIIKTMPTNRIVIETDSPYLPPALLRGQRNEPLFITLVINKLSEFLDLKVDEISNATTINAQKLFRW